MFTNSMKACILSPSNTPLLNFLNSTFSSFPELFVLELSKLILQHKYTFFTFICRIK